MLVASVFHPQTPMPARLPPLLLLTLVSTARRAAAWPDLDASSVPFAVEPVDGSSSSVCQVPPSTATALSDAGFVNVACPFGVLIAGTAAYRPDYLKYGAAVIANILDQDADGVADDPAVVAELTYRNGNRGALLACGASRAEVERGDQLGGGSAPFGYSFSCQTHHVSGESDAAALDTLKAIMQEEAFHLVHQLGYARAHPDALGLDDFTTSVAARETRGCNASGQGGTIPKTRAPPRTRASPGTGPPRSPRRWRLHACQLRRGQFYKQALFLAVKRAPRRPVEMWFSDLMPKNQSGDGHVRRVQGDDRGPDASQADAADLGAFDEHVVGVPGAATAGDESAARSPPSTHQRD